MMSIGKTLSVTPNELIQRAQTGDVEAFAALYDATRRRVFSLCLRMVHNHETAEDLTQETFVLAFTRLKTFRGDSAFTTWLHRIAVNVILMFFRKNRSIPDLTSLEPVSESGEEVNAREWGEADGNLRTSLDRIALERAISVLPNGYRLMLILHDIEGYQHEEIATMLGCSMGNTKSQLHKARLKMRELLRNPPAERPKLVVASNRKGKQPKDAPAIRQLWAPAA
jgi:RNA polymerase sigma-70 factor (ECF subfamily)